MSRTARNNALAALLLALAPLTACGPTAHSTAGSAPPAASGTVQAPPATASAAPAASPTTAAPTRAGGRPTGLPASVWTAAREIPLAASYHWQSPAAVARPVPDPRFAFEQLCHATRPSDDDLADFRGPKAQAVLGADDHADWQVQQTVVHFPGTSSDGAQQAYLLYQALQDELKACGGVKLTTTGGSDLAATVTVPEPGGGVVTLHQYLSLTGRAVVELALWSDHPAHPWTAPADAEVLKALESPICPALRDC